MLVDVWQDPDWGFEDMVSIILHKDFVAPEMEMVSFVAAPSTITIRLDQWNGEHLQFDADLFEWNDELHLNACTGVIDADLTELWLHQFGLWEQMQPFKSMSHERNMGWTLTLPVRKMLGQESTLSDVEREEFVAHYA